MGQLPEARFNGNKSSIIRGASMALDYDKLKDKHHSSGEHWTSYSDLFMVLSVVFLLLYVTSSVRSRTQSLFGKFEQQKIINENEDLKRQIKAYNALKEDYIQKEASNQELQMYENLMSKLDLLQDETKKESDDLKRQAQDNIEKVKALNQYQQMIRNVINTNLLAKKRIKRRDDVIVQKNEKISDQKFQIQGLDQTVREQSQNIEEKEKLIQDQNNELTQKQLELSVKREQVSQLSQDVANKRKLIAENTEKIATLNNNLESKINELRETYKRADSSQKEMELKIAKLRLANRKKINALKDQKDQLDSKLSTLDSQLAVANTQLINADQKLKEQEEYKKNLENEIASANENYKNKIESMKSDFQNKIATQRAQLEDQLNREKASAAEKAQRLAQFKKQADAEKEKLNDALKSLNNKVADAQSKLAAAKADHQKYLDSIKKLQDDQTELNKDVQKYKELAGAKKDLANKIAKNLRANGVNASVNPKNGDVTLSFGREYFDTGKSDLKPGMKQSLQKFVPVYAKSLLDDEKIAKNLRSVEIVGFSSPTYRGKYVDPNSLEIKDRTALNYNLDLSYKRARSIFNYMFNKEKMNYQYQNEILPLVKVTGRSFLAEGVKGRNLASGIDRDQYCNKYNCQKSQKVILRFNLKD
ncbi:MAG: hypothetical protein H6621_08755 [Halobacteriovoraceae bacterium]|nr:hypothetical protein [Halobacteriovoraceae bacterium]MCB9095143.1 hypothetical protein [Halobacteriovoraceae bacterium]